MSTSHKTQMYSAVDPYADHPWFGIRTRSNFEKTTCNILEGKGYFPYLPTYVKPYNSDGRKRSKVSPLFPGYVFCRFDVKYRLPILMTPGVISILGFASEPVPIPDSEMESFQSILTSGVGAEPIPYFREGQRVRVVGGYLQGLEGMLLQVKSSSRLVVSLTLLQRSLSVEIDSNLLLPLQ